MALKDWKKTSLGWEKKSNSSYYGDKEIIIGTHYRGKKYKNNIEVSITNEHRVVDIRYFKTKSQALKFAKSYMRKH